MLYFYLPIILSSFFRSQHPIILIHDGSQLYGSWKMMHVYSVNFFISFSD
ncbi:hypothetical protein GLYMA_03G123900v4 [Glycine max]|uniref:Uncharacterized protein n=2 Tax=Glycine subgen. Soja TaxID=1462606 RepID=A0A0R0KHX4_SOYBN|nr:hypothetical protein GYH30_007028 [Glycine max]KAH1069675.1 hypothetical protein GYH30_007028 [Glycine max]KRH66716.1 hypothetical protein GLYMA_03G123900v4 [Glycine max]KRH66717.1 hypothetical protein GLYMA_03G123900v4 [Glycine max]RZC20344.1 hypothetical protein D0Y65_006970 [Glycine soja]